MSERIGTHEGDWTSCTTSSLWVSAATANGFCTSEEQLYNVNKCRDDKTNDNFQYWYQ